MDKDHTYLVNEAKVYDTFRDINTIEDKELADERYCPLSFSAELDKLEACLSSGEAAAWAKLNKDLDKLHLITKDEAVLSKGFDLRLREQRIILYHELVHKYKDILEARYEH